MRKNVFVFFLLSCLLATSCLKTLEDEGVNDRIIVKGRVVEGGSGAAAAGVKIEVTNGNRQGEETVSSGDGSFSLTVNYDQLNEGYYLLLSADSLYQSTIYPLSGIGCGLKEYDLQIININGPELPRVSTDVVSGISQTSAVGGGTISEDGRSAIRRRGICWNKSANPTIMNSHAEAGGGTGHFALMLESLQSGQTYHVRAYAENGVGLVYGQEVTFTTLSAVPVVSTATVSDITQHSVTCGGTVSSDNGNAVTARGVCYSAISVEPTINDSRTIDGTGTGSFVSQITNLQSGTKYYIRAYASNSEGTGYGEIKVITTF